jgi:hypothetical protein
MCVLRILLWGKGGGVNVCTERVCCEHYYGEREVGLLLYKMCVVNIVMGKWRWV